MTSTADSERSPLLPQPETSSPSGLPPPPTPRPAPATPVSAARPPPSPSALVQPGTERPKPARSVTFDPNPVTRTIDPSPSSSPPIAVLQNPRGSLSAVASTPIVGSSGPASYGTISAAANTRAAVGGEGGLGPAGASGGPPVFAAINSRLRRRNSHSSVPSSTMSMAQQQMLQHVPKIGPQRSTKKAQKLKLLPNTDFGEDGPDEESGRDVYSQYTRIKDPTARRDAAYLGKADRDRLPRVTAYCTASTYNMTDLMHFLKGRGKARGANPKLIDECIYTPYNYSHSKSSNNSGAGSDSDTGGGRGSRVRISSNARLQRQQEADQRRLEQLQFEQQQRQASEMEHQRLLEQQEQEQAFRLERERQQDYFQERRHSTGELDDESQHRLREDLIDLSGDGTAYHNHQQQFQDEEAIIDYEDEGPRRRNGHNASRHGDGGMDGYYQPEHEHGEYGQRGNEVGSSSTSNDHQHLERHEHEAQEEDRPDERPTDLDTTVHTPEVFLFDYGVVVIWGMSEAHEERFLKELAKFEMEKLAPDDVEAEFFNFYYTREYQARIYNDFIALRDKNNYMTKLAISHALAQSVKTSLFEELIATTIDTCKDIPAQIAMTGAIALSRQQINMQIGDLFILRINIHLNGSVLDTPELFWVEPQLEPVYQAVRSYLEMDQRVTLLTQRLDVIADLLAVLKEQLSHGHGEMLEWIVIILIAAEILVAAINIVVDLYAGD